MSNYQANGVDFDDLFEARTSAAVANTGYQQSGVDIAQTYEGLARDQRIPTIGYTTDEGAYTGENLTDIFMGDASQYTLTTDKLTSSRGTAWNVEIEHQFTVTFASVSDRSDFLTFGGRIKINASRTGGSASAKNTDWTNMLSTMGSIELGKTNTYRNNSLTSSATGADDLTGSYLTIYSATGTGSYSENQILIQARNDSTTVIRFRVRFRDLDSGDPSIDESADGTISTSIDERRYPTVPSPVYATLTALTAGS
jgi:hypothetical protein